MSLGRPMGGKVRLVTGKTWYILYQPSASRSTTDAILTPPSYCDAQRVITDANGKIHGIGGYRVLPPSQRMIDRSIPPMRQLVDEDGKDIEGAVFLFDQENLPMSNLGIPVRSQNATGGISTLAISDPHGEAYRLAQLIFEFPEAEQVVVNGDIVDRGPGWDRIYLALTGFTTLHYNWGNHDAMWFGAGVGNKALAAELFRWLFRYNEQQKFAEIFGINFDKLEAFAVAHFSDASGNYKSKVRRDSVRIGKWMEAALTVIKLKLEAQDRYLAPERPLDESEQRILAALRHTSVVSTLTAVEKQLYDRLTSKEQADRALLDVIDRLKAGDRSLTLEEQAVVEDLTEQLLASKKFREMTLWFIEAGGMYSIVDGNLYTHSHYPVDKEGNLRPIDGKVGKEAFDAVTARVKEVGVALRIFHETGDRSALRAVESDVQWMRFLAWDYESPLYGRIMQTWERAYLKKETGTHKEPEDPFYAFLEPKRPEPKDPEIKKDPEKLAAWESGEGKTAMEKYHRTLARGEEILRQILSSFGLDPEKASFIKGHKPDKGDEIGRVISHFDGQYLNIDAVMSGPAADLEEGYGVLLVTTSWGQIIEISLAPQRREVVKETCR